MVLAFSIENLLRKSDDIKQEDGHENLLRKPDDIKQEDDHNNSAETAESDNLETSSEYSSPISDCGPLSRPSSRNSSSSSSSRRCKKARTSFTDAQIAALENRYKRQRYISPSERLQLARGLELADQQVKTWFQNRRMKEKRVLTDQGFVGGMPSAVPAPHMMMMLPGMPYPPVSLLTRPQASPEYAPQLLTTTTATATSPPQPTTTTSPYSPLLMTTSPPQPQYSPFSLDKLPLSSPILPQAPAYPSLDTYTQHLASSLHLPSAPYTFLGAGHYLESQQQPSMYMSHSNIVF